MDLQSSSLTLQHSAGALSGPKEQNVVGVNSVSPLNVSSYSSSEKNNTASNSSTAVVAQLVAGAEASAAEYSRVINGGSNIIQAPLVNANSDVSNPKGVTPIENKDQELAQAELKVVQQLASRDREVKAHEQTHAAIGGVHAGNPTFEYKDGPDGRLYATSGQVAIDTSAVDNDPRATLEKAQVIIRAALSVADPSPADRQVASEAKSMALQAISDLASEQLAGDNQNVSAQDETVRVEQEQLKREEFRAEEELKQAQLEKEKALRASRQQSNEASVEVLKEFNAEINEIQETLRRLNTQLVETGAFSKVFPQGALIDQSV